MNSKMLTRRATAALAAAGLALTLAACGSEDEPDAGEQTAVEEAQPDAVAETADADVETTDADAETHDADAETAGSEGADVEAARAGLARYLEVNRPATPQESTDIPGCPAIDQAVLEEALAEVGYPEIALEGWGTEIEWDEYSDVSEDLMGIVCAGDSDGDPHGSEFGVASGVIAVDVAGEIDPADLFPDVESTPGPAELGGEVQSMCDGTGFCVAAWHSDGFVIGTTLITEGATEATVRDLLEATLPDMLVTLAQQ